LRLIQGESSASGAEQLVYVGEGAVEEEFVDLHQLSLEARQQRRLDV
jgi:hypothetical protein